MRETRLDLSKSVGLGHKPNVVPPGDADISGELRTVELGWHPVAGSAGKWFASSLVGKQITDRVGQYPDPTQHWAVIVGDYVHQLWMVCAFRDHCEARRLRKVSDNDLGHELRRYLFQ